jgi:hypothetical protein
VKGIRLTRSGKAGRNLSAIRDANYDAVVVVVFDENFRVTDGLHIPREAARCVVTRGRKVVHNGATNL